jgi:hypothetical protein
MPLVTRVLVTVPASAAMAAGRTRTVHVNSEVVGGARTAVDGTRSRFPIAVSSDVTAADVDP